MMERILATAHGRYVMRGWDGTNGSGIEPLCDKVVVLVDVSVDKTAGGIIIPGSSAETQTMASTTGILVAVGDLAFVWNSSRTARWEGTRPVAGMRVCFQRYAGQEYSGVDGQMYRVLEDRSVAGTMGMAERFEPAEFGDGVIAGSEGVLMSSAVPVMAVGDVQQAGG